jgi:hypothetical protein
MINRIGQSKGVAYRLTDGIYMIGEADESYKVDEHGRGGVSIRASVQGWNILAIFNITELGIIEMNKTNELRVPDILLPDDEWTTISSQWHTTTIITRKGVIKLQPWSSYKPIYYESPKYLFINASSNTLAISKDLLTEIPSYVVSIKDVHSHGLTYE